MKIDKYNCFNDYHKTKHKYFCSFLYNGNNINSYYLKWMYITPSPISHNITTINNTGKCMKNTNSIPGQHQSFNIKCIFALRNESNNQTTIFWTWPITYNDFIIRELRLFCADYWLTARIATACRHDILCFAVVLCYALYYNYMLHVTVLFCGFVVKLTRAYCTKTSSQWRCFKKFKHFVGCFAYNI